MRFWYDLFFLIFSVGYLPFFLSKGKHKGGLGSRFGRVPRVVREGLAGQRVIWVHAVSVGEVVQAIRLVNGLREKNPDARFVLTTTTAAGREVASQLKDEKDTLLYMPIDFRFCVRRFIRGVSPSVVVILETEIWPNLVFELSDRTIPVYIVNGRISDRAMPKYRLLKSFMARVLGRISGIGVQDERMRSRFLELGARPEQVHVTGNMKFDWRPIHVDEREVETIGAFIRPPDSLLWIAGSTHAGEEERLFGVYRLIQARCARLNLLIAPRHLDRLESIEKKAAQMGLTTVRITDLANPSFDDHSANRGRVVVFLLDKMGILAGLYKLADIVFVGGSLVKVGGHNLVEPAFFEKPVLFGPFMQNFKEMADEFRRAEAALEVKDASDLLQKVLGLIEDPSRAVRLGTAAKRLVARHQGAVNRSLQLLALESAPQNHAVPLKA